MSQDILPKLSFVLVAGISASFSIMTIQSQASSKVLIANKSNNKVDAKKGAVIYKQNCAVCHGDTGKADGPAARSLTPKPRDFTQGIFQYAKSDTELLAFIKQGKSPMPAWGQTLKDEQIKDVIAFIHTLKAKKPKY